jgi:hypothetical protein
VWQHLVTVAKRGKLHDMWLGNFTKFSPWSIKNVSILFRISSLIFSSNTENNDSHCFIHLPRPMPTMKLKKVTRLWCGIRDWFKNFCLIHTML